MSDDNYERPDVSRQLFGMEFSEGHSSGRTLITLCIEDDGWWHRKDVQFDSAWLGDLIACATAARERLAGTHQ